jgi:hypothetical protein
MPRRKGGLACPGRASDPISYWTCVNVARSARELGLTISREFLLVADDVVE